jgi:hypothetical protein
MREFDLGHVISAHSHYSGSLNSLWGLFVAASFSAAGFGASMASKFTVGMALAVTIAYLIFAAGHLFAILTFVKKLREISGEVCARFEANPADFTDYPRTAAVFFGPVLSPSQSVLIHMGIDACIVIILWSGLLWPGLFVSPGK